MVFMDKSSKELSTDQPANLAQNIQTRFKFIFLLIFSSLLRNIVASTLKRGFKFKPCMILFSSLEMSRKNKIEKVLKAS